MVFDFTPDDFCQSFPAYFVSEDLLNDLIDQKITGFCNPRLITHEQNEQSTVKVIEKRYFMIDMLCNDEDDIKIIDRKLFVNEKVRGILNNYNLRFANFC